MSQKKQKRLNNFRAARLAVIGAVLSCFVAAPFVHADAYQQQINSLDAQNNQTQGLVNNLQTQASSYKDAISKLQSQIVGLEDSISINENKQAELQSQIQADQAKLAEEKSVLGSDIKAMYVDGQLTTIEELATSKNLSDFVDAETYRNAVQTEVQNTMTQIANLENQLQDQKTEIGQLINLQTQQRNQLANSQAQENQLLAYNESQQTTYNQQIASNNSQIATLRAEQIAANRRLVSSNGSHVDYSGSCGGSYPASASGPSGNWGCNYSLDNTIDNWGMYNRECVSYTAWMVYKTYGYMPYWGGSGDANQWPGDAQAAGIPTGSTPKAGSVAIYMGGAGDPWGHAMWVKSVNGDGTITVDQYNLYYDGNFYETTISSSGLVYIYFGQ